MLVQYATKDFFEREQDVESDIIIENDMAENDMIVNDMTENDMTGKRELIFLPKFRLKDYGCQKGRDIYCSFKYLAVVYDQMCRCADEFGKEDRFLECQVENEDDNLGFVQLSAEEFRALLDDINFEFDSTIEMDYSQIASDLQKMLHAWCPKISTVYLNTEHLYLTSLDGYDIEMIAEIINSIRLQNRHMPIEDLKKLKFLAMDFQVVFNDLFYFNLRDIGLNLSYCNYLIFRFLQKSYRTCGFYLTNHPITKRNLPLYDGKEVKSAYCHLYLVPLNLSRQYYNYGKAIPYEIN